MSALLKKGLLRFLLFPDFRMKIINILSIISYFWVKIHTFSYFLTSSMISRPAVFIIYLFCKIPYEYCYEEHWQSGW